MLDTIFAVSSGSGRAGVAVVRVSGSAAGLALERIAGKRPEARRASLRALRDPETAEVIDRGLVLWFPAPWSFTGEDVVEFHIHAGRAVTRRISAALASIPGLRPAMPGDFTRRAFANGRMDLAEVEGLSALIEAETEAQRRFALRAATGEHSRLYESWRGALVDGMAIIEAMIDFSDEGDVPADALEDVGAALRQLRDAIADHLAGGVRGERLADGVRVVIAGPPNAGKSTLLNAIAGRDVAIVSDEAGTTRDVLEVRLDLGGWPVTLCDTAGLRKAASRVEQEGVRRAEASLRSADLVLWLSPSDEPVQPPADVGPCWVVTSKCDLGVPPGDGAHRISVLGGIGVDRLLCQLERFASDTIAQEAETPSLARERHRVILERVRRHLDSALVNWGTAPYEVLADELRRSAAEIGRLTGLIGVEDVLGSIFSRFCIGK